MTYAASIPVVDYIDPALAVYTAPVPVSEYVASAPVNGYEASAPVKVRGTNISSDDPRASKEDDDCPRHREATMLRDVLGPKFFETSQLLGSRKKYVSVML